jgi:hypothetical protein
MRTGNAGRWTCMCVLLAVPAAAASSCGGAPNNADVFAGGLDGSLTDGSSGSSGGSGSSSGVQLHPSGSDEARPCASIPHAIALHAS